MSIRWNLVVQVLWAGACLGFVSVSGFAEDKLGEGGRKKVVATDESPAKASSKGTAAEKSPSDKPAGADAETANRGRTASHKQARTIVPTHDGVKVRLHTFCLAPNGDILACVGGASRYAAAPKGAGDEKAPSSFVQVYSHEGKLKAEYPVDFTPTAINVTPKGELVIAGSGRMARLTSGGKIITQGPTPNIGDLEAFKKKATDAAKAEAQQFEEQSRQQLKRVEEAIAEIEKTPEEKRTKRQKSRLEALRESKDEYAESIKESSRANEVDIEQTLLMSMRVTAIAATAEDLFVCCRSSEGHGYDVWRCNHDLKNGKSIVSGLGGCCGQLDIQARGETLYVAENGRFRVSSYDRDGELLESFGKRGGDADSLEGWGSCCNPMNIRCCENGELLVAESSIGNIKRYTAKGEFLALIGKARIAGGCKHVAIGWDADRDLYYMMHEDKGHLCVLVPQSQATGEDEDEKAARLAREGLGRKLAGTTWSLDRTPSDKKNRDQEQPGADAEEGQGVRRLGIFDVAMFDRIEFQKDFALDVKGGTFGDFLNGQKWNPVRQTDDTLVVAMRVDNVDSLQLRVQFLKSGKIRLSLLQGDDDETLAAATYRPRTAEDERAEQAAQKAADDAEARAAKRTRRNNPRSSESEPQ